MMSANPFILAGKATWVSLNMAFADICAFGSFLPSAKVVQRAATSVMGAIQRDDYSMVSSIDFQLLNRSAEFPLRV